MNNIKKLLCLMLSLLLLVSVSACGKSVEYTSEDIIGTWVFSNYTELKEYLTNVLDDSYFYQVFYKFNEDGTGSTWLENTPDYVNTFTYEFNITTLTIFFEDGSSQVIPIDFKGDRFTVENDGNKMVFTKE